jgi:hypothetical protein
MRSLLVSFATVVTLIAADGLAGEVPTASADTSGVGVVPTVDVPAPQLSETRRGAQATRIELDGANPDELSAWYRLAYIERGTRLRVFEHYAATVRGPGDDMVISERTAWILANKAVEPDHRSTVSDRLPAWAWFRTGNDTGPSAGLMFALTYIDQLTPGALVGDLRVAGTGSIGKDGVVLPVSNVEIKVAAALLAEPDVIFSPRPSKFVENTTVIESEHTRIPADGYTIGEWLNVRGYEQAGRDAANRPGVTAFVVVHDFRQALAFLCGRTSNETTCAAANRSITIPIEIS